MCSEKDATSGCTMHRFVGPPLKHQVCHQMSNERKENCRKSINKNSTHDNSAAISVGQVDGSNVEPSPGRLYDYEIV